MEQLERVIHDLETVEVFLRGKLRTFRQTDVEAQYQRAILRLRDARESLTLSAQDEPADIEHDEIGTPAAGLAHNVMRESRMVS